MGSSLKAIKLILPEMAMFCISTLFIFSPWTYSYLISQPTVAIGAFCLLYALVQFLILKLIWPWSKSSKVRNLLLADAQPTTEALNAVTLALGLWVAAHAMFVLFGAPFLTLVV